MTRSHVDVPGGSLLVVDEGSGPPIVLLHAGIADLRSWDALVPGLTAAGYRAVRFDQRGVGGSSTEPVAFSGVDDLLAVLDAAGIGRAVLVGNSLGGIVAIGGTLPPGRKRPDGSWGHAPRNQLRRQIQFRVPGTTRNRSTGDTLGPLAFRRPLGP